MISERRIENKIKHNNNNNNNTTIKIRNKWNEAC